MSLWFYERIEIKPLERINPAAKRDLFHIKSAFGFMSVSK